MTYWAIFTICLLSLLAVASFVDLRTRKIPDAITYPLIVIGLVGAAIDRRLESHLVAALTGFLAFWMIGRIYKASTNKTGLGLGDAKLLGAAGAWLGPWQLAPVVLFASLGALAVVIAAPASGSSLPLRLRVVAFGPFLSLAIAVLWLLPLRVT